LGIADDEVTFWYKDSKTKRRVYVTLPVFHFIRRFLRHLLLQGFVKVRYDGFLAAGQRHRLTFAGELLATDYRQPHEQRTARPQPGMVDTAETARLCPKWGLPMSCVETIRPHSRCPP
jgi:hypothetical protein